MPVPTRDERPTFSRFPYIVQYPPPLREDDISIANSITDEFDRRLVAIKAKGQEFVDRYCKPTYCPEEYLDWLASVLLGVEFVWWNSAWTRDQKVRILNNIPFIRQRMGSVKLFNWLVLNFDLDAILEPDEIWIVGNETVATELPSALGATSFDWTITIPVRYTERSPEFKLIQLILEWFMPCWIDFFIQYVPNEFFD